MSVSINKRIILTTAAVTVSLFFFIKPAISHAEEGHHEDHSGHSGMKHEMPGGMHHDVKWVNGKVVSISENALTIKESDDKEHVYVISDDTYVYIHDVRKKIEDVKAGDGVNLQYYASDEGKNKVTSINIWGADGHKKGDDYEHHEDSHKDHKSSHH